MIYLLEILLETLSGYAIPTLIYTFHLWTQKVVIKHFIIEVLLYGIDCSLHLNRCAPCSLLEEPSIPPSLPCRKLFSFSNIWKVCWYCRTSLPQEKAAPCFSHTEKLFSSDTRQSMKRRIVTEYFGSLFGADRNS